MLATMNISQSTASIHQNNQLDLQLGRGDHVDIDKICPGCKLTAVTDDGGVVVAFGCVAASHTSRYFAAASPTSMMLHTVLSLHFLLCLLITHKIYRQSFFHVNCFRCAKCQNKVTADTNLLLLSDGSPVCANCSYNCNVCKQPILDEAIMTGDDSYHAHCFKCKVCRNRIDELVFAKTSQGIYCMDCHNERMIKIRRHAQKKAEREKAAAAGGSGSSSSRDARVKRDMGVRILELVYTKRLKFPSLRLQVRICRIHQGRLKRITHRPRQHLLPVPRTHLPLVDVGQGLTLMTPFHRPLDQDLNRRRIHLRISLLYFPSHRSSCRSMLLLLQI